MGCNMNAHTPLDPGAVKAANDIMGRLRPLAETLANARAYRAFLENLRDRDTSAVREPHVSSIHMARSGFLRAAIGTIMAALDKPGTDRASVGQIIHMFQTLLAGSALSVLADRWPHAGFGATTLQQAEASWNALVDSAEFQECKDFRDGNVGHTLIFAMPTVPTDAYFRLHDAAEELTLRFYAICGYGKPEFEEHRDQLAAHAKTFWDTYWLGMVG